MTRAISAVSAVSTNDELVTAHMALIAQVRSDPSAGRYLDIVRRVVSLHRTPASNPAAINLLEPLTPESPRALRDISAFSRAIPWAEWKATALNRIWQEHATTSKPARITADTVRHGERKASL